MHLCNCSTPGFRQIGCAAFYSHHHSHPAGLCVFGYSYTMYRVGYWRRCGTSGLRVYISVRKASCRWCVSARQPACQKSLAEFAARRPRIRFDPFFAAAPPKGTSVGRVRREKYFALASAQRNWPRQTRRLMSGQSVFVGACAHGRAGRSEIPFVKKGRRPFLTSSASVSRGIRMLFVSFTTCSQPFRQSPAYPGPG